MEFKYHMHRRRATQLNYGPLEPNRQAGKWLSFRLAASYAEAGFVKAHPCCEQIPASDEIRHSPFSGESNIKNRQCGTHESKRNNKNGAAVGGNAVGHPRPRRGRSQSAGHHAGQGRDGTRRTELASGDLPRLFFDQRARKLRSATAWG